MDVVVDDTPGVPAPAAAAACGGAAPADAAEHALLATLRAARREPDAKQPPGVRAFYAEQNSFIDWALAAAAERAALEAARLKGLARRAERAAAASGAASSPPASPSSAAAAPEPRGGAGGAGGAGGVPLSAAELRTARLVSVAINLSFAANLALLAIKIAAAVASGSLAVVASLVDSVMDIVSGGVVFASARLAARRDPHGYPVGKSRYEPLSVIVLAVIMGAASLQLVSEGAQELASGLAPEGGAGAEAAAAALQDARVAALTFSVLGVIIAVKAALFVWCRALKGLSSAVGALALDHFGDVVTNTLPLAAVIVTSRVPRLWWVDPLAAIAMSLYMISLWLEAAGSQVALISGRAASPREVRELAFLALTNDARITAVDTVLAYQLGSKLQVELDVVLPPDTPLLVSHDIGEALQRRVEALPNVERAFVHLDYSSTDHVKDDEHYNPYDQPGYSPEDD
jgi:cation diffusion facilitator family transporter